MLLHRLNPTWVCALLACAASVLPACDAPPHEQTVASLDTAHPALSIRHPPPDARPVEGFADLHLHMMAEEGFGGGWLHGAHDGPGALADCDGGGSEAVVLYGDHARVRSDLSSLASACPSSQLVQFAAGSALDTLLRVGGVAASEVLGQTEGTGGDTGLHLQRKAYGSGWPRWDTIAHHQSWGEDLRAAHERGLNLVVMSAVSYGWLCELLPPSNRTRGCDEMEDVRIQLRMAQEFAARNDDWLEIALSASEARAIVNRGKLAMVLSVEASHILGRDVNAQNLRARVDELYGLGVRTLQLVHQQDNPFAGAATHHPVFQFAAYTENCHIDTDCGLTTGSVTLGFDVDSQCRNVRGLTPLGTALVADLMDRGMLIDGAHLSERSLDGLFELTESARYYPVYISHGHFREMMTGSTAQSEKSTPASVIRRIRQSGGMFGLRTAHDETHAYARAPIDNACHGSSTSFAQAYSFGQEGLKVAMGFGSDLNGFIQQTRPRFGDMGACSAGSRGEGQCQEQNQRQHGTPRLGSDFDDKGLAHVGLLPDLRADLRNMGVDTRSLDRSAEAFVAMWERAEGVRRGAFEDARDLDTSDVLVDRTAEDRARDYPTSCGKSYCPRSRPLGYDCALNAECESEQCTAVACGTVGGRCVCDDDGDCGAGRWCDRDVPLVGGDNRCRAGKSDHDTCSRDAMCASGQCGGITSNLGFCYTPRSKNIGQGCRANAECTTGRCVDLTFVCGCTDHGQCGSGRFCGWGTNSGKCMNKRDRYAACVNGFECKSGTCRFGLCTKP